MQKRIAILGSTGSIGESTFDIVTRLPETLTVTGIAARSNAERLAEQAHALGCRWVHAAAADAHAPLAGKLPAGCIAATGQDALCELVSADNVDLVLCAIVGTDGLKPVLAAIRAGKDIALASKEILVLAGSLVTAEARRHGVRILPVDSEHCAIHQSLGDAAAGTVRRLILTASGGPFHAFPERDLTTVTPEEALRHPTWKMGKKVTIDSATLMNKALEVIEAHWLFGMAPGAIETVVHPQSIIHSMVEFVDGSIVAQMGNPDMRLPIQYCLTYPRRCPGPTRPMNFAAPLSLQFDPLDERRFPAVRLAKRALKLGGTAPGAFNAANEVAVEAFCRGRLRFTDIAVLVEGVLDRHPLRTTPTLEGILADDRLARETAATLAARLFHS